MITKVALPLKAVVGTNEIQGSPPRIIYLAARTSDGAFFETTHWGLYVSALEIVGKVKIFNFHHHSEVATALKKYQDNDDERLLHLTDAAPVDYDCLSSEIMLPTGDLGLTLKGFPPIISQIDISSPIHHMIQVGQRIDRLIVRAPPPPHCCCRCEKNMLDWSLSSGGFTDQRVTKALNEHINVEGRIIVVVTDDPRKKECVTDGDHHHCSWFDMGSFQDTPRWSWRRLFSDRPSQHMEKAQSKDYAPVKNMPLT